MPQQSAEGSWTGDPDRAPSAYDKDFGYKHERPEQTPGLSVWHGRKKMVEMRGFEPLASALRTRRSPN
jgi:hypothetical protein